MQNTSEHDAPVTPSPILALRENWDGMPFDERVQAFSLLPRADANAFFLSLKPNDQAEILQALPTGERQIWLRSLALDDLADVMQEIPDEARGTFLDMVDTRSRREVAALMAYKEDEAGGLMNPRFARVRPDMHVEEAIRYLRQQAQSVETTRYVYVLKNDQTLIGVVSLRSIFRSSGDVVIRDIAKQNVITANENMNQDELAALFSKSALNAVPVVDDEGHMKGIITVDDIVQVVEEEATKDIHRLGGSEELESPYLQTSLFEMVRKRAGWLIVLFLGEMLTASAMTHFEGEISKAVVLALFIPLIISSGGNTGSQASTLVVRAIALREVRLRDWWRILLRELVVGTVLGLILGSIGLVRIFFWPDAPAVYGEHFRLIGMTVAASLVGIVLWGSVSGSMLPFILKRLKLDPATASAPFVATLVDVSGLIIYFTTASFFLKGALL